MPKSLKDLAKLALPLNKEKKRWLEMAAHYLDEEDLRQLRYYVKIDRCFGVVQRFGTTKKLFEDKEWPYFKSHLDGKELHDFLDNINNQITQKAKLDAFLHFAPTALRKITKAIAPNIVGLQESKRAAALQLFAKDPVHILLIGDPGTGKTDILRSVNEIAPISSFGLGSGVSGVGLSAAAKGDEILRGLLPLAHEGIACIDELNLIKAKDLAALYNAMEKGFVSYDKGTKHETLPAKVRVCATANPKEQTFVGKSAEVLRKQIPFGDALLSRFHLIYIVRKPSEKEFEEIAKKIVKGQKTVLPAADAAFLKQYVEHTESLEIEFPNELELEVVEFVKKLKKDERKFLQEIGPRTVVGTVRLVKAAARADLSSRVEGKHLDEAFDILKDALYVRKEEP